MDSLQLYLSVIQNLSYSAYKLGSVSIQAGHIDWHVLFNNTSSREPLLIVGA
jgi:hypothetical protein